MSFSDTLRFVLSHPLNVDRKVSALFAFVRWHVGSRIVGTTSVVVPFVDGTRLIAEPGLTGVTGNVYAGLHEFEDMAFVLHVLRDSDTFVDVGANVGAYTVLAAGGVGASCVAIEPIPSSYCHLLDNLHLNALIDRVEALNVGVGSVRGILAFTEEFDTTNHVLPADEGRNGIEVPIRTLDEIMGDRDNIVVKIDVEGYEMEVLAGARNLLKTGRIVALTIETNDSGARYGYSDQDLHSML